MAGTQLRLGKLLRYGTLILSMAAVVKGEEEGAGNPADFSVAMMLLATVTFMMSTFYLVNMEDEDLRKAAWQVISSTISIFAAVLLFQAVNEMVAYYVLGLGNPLTEEEVDKNLKLGVNFAHAALWYLALQIALAGISGAVSAEELCGSKKAAAAEEQEEAAEAAELSLEEEGEGGENEEEKEKVEAAELLMKCWATLFGHITGFACINAFGTLQCRLAGEMAMSTEHITPVGHSTWVALSAVLVALVVLQIIFKIFDVIRDRIALGDDGRKDAMEVLWDDETEETEDDVLGLTISFTIVQVIRFAITGVLPNEEGEIEGGELEYTTSQAFMLIGAGVTIFFLHILRENLMKTWQHAKKFARMKEQIKVVSGMIFAWCFFFGTMWLVGIALKAGNMDMGEGTISAVCLAMTLTFMSYIMIFALDKLADADWTDADVDRTLRELIKALGILIGFAWEKSFDAAVVNIAAKVLANEAIPAPVTKLALSILVCITVIPAWLWYILPELQKLGVFDEEAEEEEGVEPGAKEAKGGDAEAGDNEEPLLKQDKELLKQMKQDEKDRVERMKALQKEFKKNTEATSKITSDIKKALAEVNKVKGQLESGK